MQHFYNPLSFLGDSEHDSVFNEGLDDLPDTWKPFFQLLRQHNISTLITTGSAMNQIEWSKVTPRDFFKTMKEARGVFQNRIIRIKVSLHILEIIVRFAREHALKITDKSLISFETMGLEALRGTLGNSGAQSACSLMRCCQFHYHIIWPNGSRQLKPVETQALLEDLFHFVHNLPSSARIMEREVKQELVIAKNGVDEDALGRIPEFLSRHFRYGSFSASIMTRRLK